MDWSVGVRPGGQAAVTSVIHPGRVHLFPVLDRICLNIMLSEVMIICRAEGNGFLACKRCMPGNHSTAKILHVQFSSGLPEVDKHRWP